MFIILKTGYFQVWFLYKSDLRISTAGKHNEISKTEHFYLTKTTVAATLLTI